MLLLLFALLFVLFGIILIFPILIISIYGFDSSSVNNNNNSSDMKPRLKLPIQGPVCGFVEIVPPGKIPAYYDYYCFST